MESLGLSLYLSRIIWARVSVPSSTSMNSRFGKPRSFLPWRIPSSLPNTLFTTHVTSSHVKVDVYAFNSPFSIFRSISLAFG